MVRHISAQPQAACSSSADSDYSEAYDAAVRTLNSLQSNKAALAKVRKERGANNHLVMPKMRRYLERAGVKDDDLRNLSVVHVSGTKGKGSTCAFTESILRHHGYKTGFFSSPHLVEVRERIRIDGEPLSRKKFTEYFWNTYEPLLRTSQDETVANSDDLDMPMYFKFLTIMAIHAFIEEKVDVAVVEVGIGGEYDATNVLPSPVVCGVSSLGLDHTDILGKTIKSIAWHKAGIFKPSAVAFTVPQPPEAMDVLAQRAEERDTSVSIVPSILTSYCSYGNDPASLTDPYNTEDFVDSGSGNPLKLGIHGQAQFWNASLALHLAQAWMDRRESGGAQRMEGDGNQNTLPFQSGGIGQPRSSLGSQSSTASGADVSLSPCFSLGENVTPIPLATPFPLLPPHLAGLRRTFWPGRSQVIKIHSEMTLYLDGAHTVDSIQNCASWFKEESFKEKVYNDSDRKNFNRVLLFNLTGARDPVPLLERLVDIDFDLAIFCPNSTSSASIATNSADQTKKSVDDSSNRKTCMENIEAWQRVLSARATGEHSSKTSPFLYIQSIGDSLDFLNVNYQEKIIVEGEEVQRPPWLIPGNHVQILGTGSLYLVGGILKLVDPDLDGILLND